MRKKWSSSLFPLYTDGCLYKKSRYCINILKSLPFILFGHYTKFAGDAQPNDVWNDELKYLIFIPNLERPRKNLWLLCDNRKQFTNWVTHINNFVLSLSFNIFSLFLFKEVINADSKTILKKKGLLQSIGRQEAAAEAQKAVQTNQIGQNADPKCQQIRARRAEAASERNSGHG